MQYEPVCGAKQVQCVTAPCYPQYHTYGNACMMANDGATLIHTGECKPEESGKVVEPPKATSTSFAFTPPESCRTWFDGCNSCARMSDGKAACTKRYCAEPQAGYCTTFDKGKPGSSTDEYEAPSASSPETPIEEQEEFKPFSFIKRFWMQILSWFVQKAEALTT
ncbi:MAG TPA: hypothetical protein VD967_02990, partial [Candidatus Paceibacterota bacterium]|nr:hypothetical protein [Candidatus Paceibacterota bacterium]